MNIDGYIDAALKAGDFPSERQLSIFLGFGPDAICTYRTKRCWPSDDTMIRLAEIAGADPERALLDLNLWRATSGRVKATYSRIREKLTSGSRSVAQVLVLIGSLLAIVPANAAATAQPLVSPSIHYAIFRRRAAA